MTTALVALGAVVLLVVQALIHRSRLAALTVPEPQRPSAEADDGLLSRVASLDEELRSIKEQGERDSFLARYLDCILDSMTSGVIVFDILSRITLINQEAEGIFKRSGGDLVGRMLLQCPNLSELFRLINTVRSSRPLMNRSNQQYEVQIEDFEGNSIPLGVSINGLVDDRNTVMGYVVICKDLSERRRMIANLERAEKLSALGTMASGVAHNFNNILAAILGRVQLLLRYPDKAKIIEGLRTIEKSALDGAATVKRIQDFARKRPVQDDFTAVDANVVVRDAVSFMRARLESRGEGEDAIVAEEVLEASRPVHGSPSELREVLINLILNATDAMPRGGVLRVRSESDLTTVRLVVSDTGTGMSDEVRRRIFDPFFTTKGVKGTGLGLSESYGIVKRHKGTISCESREGEGTTFVVELPVASGRFEVPLGVPVGTTASVFDRRLQVLVVDDDEAQCELMRDILAADRHAVALARGGGQAVELLGTKTFDLIISDLSMPDLDGWALVSRARELQPAVKTIIMSGLPNEFTEERVAATGVDVCLPKPVTLEALHAALVRIFS